MPERRKLKRQFLIYFGRVYDRQNGQTIGNLADISVEGAMIISNRAIDAGKVHLLRLDLPEEVFKIDHIDLDAQSIWCRPDIDPALYNVGFQLINMDPDRTSMIELLIKQYGIRESKSLSN